MNKYLTTFKPAHGWGLADSNGCIKPGWFYYEEHTSKCNCLRPYLEDGWSHIPIEIRAIPDPSSINCWLVELMDDGVLQPTWLVWDKQGTRKVTVDPLLADQFDELSAKKIALLMCKITGQVWEATEHWFVNTDVSNASIEEGKGRNNE